MSEVINENQNLNSYYTTLQKVDKPERIVVNGPESIPNQHVFNDREATLKWRKMNNDIYEGAKKKEKQESGVLKFIIGVGLAVLGIKGIKYLIKFFRKS